MLHKNPHSRTNSQTERKARHLQTYFPWTDVVLKYKPQLVVVLFLNLLKPASHPLHPKNPTFNEKNNARAKRSCRQRRDGTCSGTLLDLSTRSDLYQRARAGDGVGSALFDKHERSSDRVKLTFLAPRVNPKPVSVIDLRDPRRLSAGYRRGTSI